ncbi:MAG: pyridoxamine 5'-phosphate oxidase family protein [Candidatus Omnitrophica bacterium]|nr:pyridoxamine 5'-phosphate oxidase family protein [Candidatus Omnitrophota bacterium]
MGKTYEQIDDKLADWIKQQHVFFVATAPLAADSHVNCSPKGGQTFKILDPLTVAYQDYTGSGIETAAHLKENGRIVIMFCAFTGAPKIIRLYGRGEVIAPGHVDYPPLLKKFSENPGTRAIIRVKLDRIADSCGMGVPFLEYRRDRDALDKWARAKGPEQLREYRREKNTSSVDGLPGLNGS